MIKRKYRNLKINERMISEENIYNKRKWKK